MIRILLSQSEESALQSLRRCQNSNVGERAYYILLAYEGLSPPQIANRLGRNIITIRLWLSRYIQEGISGLSSKKQPGRPAVKAAILESELSILLSHSPQDYGYSEAGWQINILKDYFRKQGCRICDNTLIKALRKLGYVYKRFSKTLPKNAPTAESKKSAISDIVSSIGKEPGDIEIFFEDESHFSNQPYVNRGWFKKGEKKQFIHRKTD
jgi:transposase